MWRFGVLLTAALVLGAEAQDASCGRDLASISARLNDVCCAGDAADCTGGSARGPRYCSADCAALWNPFYSRCSRFVDASMPALASFSTQCQSQSPAAGSQGAGATFDPDWSDGCGGALFRRHQTFRFVVAESEHVVRTQERSRGAHVQQLATADGAVAKVLGISHAWTPISTTQRPFNSR